MTDIINNAGDDPEFFSHDFVTHGMELIFMEGREPAVLGRMRLLR
ncbi:MAG TPA: hypothetical protein PLS93_17655 [Accumulibacter sp.]|nr:hypothetical protein [Accumulibacter sp.]